jgi:hypothetical protein
MNLKHGVVMIYKNYFVHWVIAFFMVPFVAVYASHPTDEENEEPEINLTANLNVGRASRSSTHTSHANSQLLSQRLRDKAEEHEDNGNILAAAQIMDRLLKISHSPALEDLCCALNLNQKIATKYWQKRTHEIVGQISPFLRGLHQ